MNENPTASDWSSTRGEKWLAQLAGMEAMMAPVDEPLIRALRLETPGRIADVGCGGGGATLEILRLAPSGSVVHGFDISADLIELARKRKNASTTTLAFEVADMATAAAPERLYDRIASRFGVMFFSDPPAAFANLAGWLVPGGRFAFVVWGPLGDNPWMTVTREVVAKLVEIPPPQPDAPGPFRYGSADRLLAMLKTAGFAELEMDNWQGLLPIGGGLPAADAANFALSAFSSFGELLAAAGERAVAEARQRLTQRFSLFEKGGTVNLGASVHIVAGKRIG